MTDPAQRDDLPASLTRTLASSDLTAVGADLAEVSLDALIEDGVLRDIPVIRTVVGLWKTGVTVRDALFLRKLATFLTNLDDTTAEAARDDRVTRR